MRIHVPLPWLSLLIPLSLTHDQAQAKGVVASSSCSKDSDCDALNRQEHMVPQAPGTDRFQFSFLCIKSHCQLVLGAGEQCTRSSQCAEYVYLAPFLSGESSLNLNTSSGKQKTTSNSPFSTLFDDHWLNAAYLNETCHPAHCSLQSTCDESASDLAVSSLLPSPLEGMEGGCCRGSSIHRPCTKLGSVLDTCSLESICHVEKVDSSGAALPSTCEAQILPPGKEWIGIILCLLGGIAINLGLNIQKMALRRAEKKRRQLATTRFSSLSQGSGVGIQGRNPNIPDDDELVEASTVDSTPPDLKCGSFFSNPLWLLGFFMFLSSNILNVFALQFAPQSLVAPLGSVSIISNIIFAPLLNHEKRTHMDIIGAIIIVLGSALVVAFAGRNSMNYKVCVLISLFKRPSTIVYLSIIAALSLGIFLFLLFTERKDARNRALERENIRISKMQRPLSVQSVAEAMMESSYAPLLLSLNNDQESKCQEYKISSTSIPLTVVDNTAEPNTFTRFSLCSDSFIRLKKASAERAACWLHDVGLPFAYAALGGFMATLTTLFAKVSIILVTDAIQGGPQNEFLSGNPFPWLITGLTVMTAISQIYWINQGLQRYDALLQIPVFYVVWTVCNVIGGGIYFDEFTSMPPVSLTFFILGVSVILAGVCVLAQRLKK